MVSHFGSFRTHLKTYATAQVMRASSLAIGGKVKLGGLFGLNVEKRRLRALGDDNEDKD